MLLTAWATELSEVRMPRIGATSREDCSNNPVITENMRTNFVLNGRSMEITENSDDFAPMLNGFSRPTLLLQGKQRIATPLVFVKVRFTQHLQN